MTPAQTELANDLIGGVISHWAAIGKSSVEGFRGNWLVREGILQETEEQWELIVQTRPYDILMQTIPFSYNLIWLPWMDKPIYVTWGL
jgi:hypothetical protein